MIHLSSKDFAGRPPHIYLQISTTKVLNTRYDHQGMTTATRCDDGSDFELCMLQWGLSWGLKAAAILIGGVVIEYKIGFRAIDVVKALQSCPHLTWSTECSIH